MEIVSEPIPVLEITEKACKALSIDPLKMISSGVLLIATGKGEILKAALNASGIPSEIIGKVVKTGITIDGEPIMPPEGDELLKLL